MATKILAAELYDAFTNNGVAYYSGVPDSLLAPLIRHLDEVSAEHETAVSEGHAVALATGYYLATGKLPVVYMQNSGLGNATNPLLSLVDQEVMGVPVVLLVGWRGRPGVTDEPQHKKQGAVTMPLLEALGIPGTIVSSEPTAMTAQIRDAVQLAKRELRPVALVVPENVLVTQSEHVTYVSQAGLSREEAIHVMADTIPLTAAVVATTGKTGRELFEYRSVKGVEHDSDLLIVGGMGYASAIAQSVAKRANGRDIYVIDGDGAALMHLGVVAYNGTHGTSHFYHLLINNGTHESVGGQPTIARGIDLQAIAKASGYAWAARVGTKEELARAMENARDVDGAVFIEIMTTSSSRSDLSRPTMSPSRNKTAFMSFLKNVL